MKNKISLSMNGRFAKALIDLLHNKPSAEVELIRAEAEKIRADAKLKKAKSNYVSARAQKEKIQNWYFCRLWVYHADPL